MVDCMAWKSATAAGLQVSDISKTRIPLVDHRETSLKLTILQIDFNCRLTIPTSAFLFASIPNFRRWMPLRKRQTALRNSPGRASPGPLLRGIAIYDGSAFNSHLVCSKERHHSP
ncbi:hypothetical protein USDA257_c36790 [Sinorhizobium fredii USDA 257]|uniref:Uncharacterized protein n=1 Tax=Sinorhizobium fredii (strain USDA 257) TaxID=1185652 RepID=I3X8M3_SINF2|nr:hypothetical protein USDA257_c36790 [Sinorhizobium fredii USDA 257]